jgi:PPOX class probable F420-dependent enzyme
MTPAEVAGFLDEQLVVTVATLGPRGWPHLMPLWFVVRDEVLWGWTYGKSQKIRNLERDPRCTLQMETGQGDYSELRGVMIEAEATIHRDLETVTRTGTAIAERYGGGRIDAHARAAIAAQAGKRVALEFVPRRTATWDHRKLGGVY